MRTLIVDKWRYNLFRGVLAVAFGLLALLWPGITLEWLILIFGMYVLVEGIFTTAAGVAQKGQIRYWWVLAVEGLSEMVVGLAALLWPGLTAAVFLVFIAAWAIITGMIEIVVAIQIRKKIRGEWALGLAGIVSVVIGMVLASNPATGAVAIVWMVGAYAIVFGGILIYSGLKLKNLFSS